MFREEPKLWRPETLLVAIYGPPVYKVSFRHLTLPAVNAHVVGSLRETLSQNSMKERT